MVEIQNANDVDLFIENADASPSEVGTAPSAGRLAVDNFSITTTEENMIESGVGNEGPIGHSRGNRGYEFSFVIKGDDLDLFQAIAGPNGRSKDFNFRARGLETGVDVETARHTSIEYSGTDGETTEWAVEGNAIIANYAAA